MPRTSITVYQPLIAPTGEWEHPTYFTEAAAQQYVEAYVNKYHEEDFTFDLLDKVYGVVSFEVYKDFDRKDV